MQQLATVPNPETVSEWITQNQTPVLCSFPNIPNILGYITSGINTILDKDTAARNTENVCLKM